ncbi:MAG TPA: gliding motility-associated C-terminal domain-containing protein, partial [Flavobacteriales bacterium]|nr:gliding motility-associated C-terminal domain-containing protein [Flavobacteriales bacterium]
STGKLFIGGAGGAGDQNDGDAGGGGRGAGLVFIMSYGTVSGSGTIVANGNAGTSALNSGGGFNGKDGAGGGGAGGTVIINSNSTISGITINANGGSGGNVNLTGAAAASFESYGPGGGGGGGYIAVSNGTPTRTATGGVNGTTNSLAFTEFPPKGATSGNTGLPTETYSNYYFTLNNVSICYGATATLTATVTGTVPGGTTLNWYATQFSTASLGTGTTFTTPALTTTTTYYVGFCPGWYRLPVTVTVGPQIVINTSSMVITNATCGLNNGSITGITASGGTGALTYTWNGTLGTANLTGIGAGSYTLVVTDASSCTASVGPFAVTATTSPVINTASMVITNSTCGSSNGSISGITVSGGSGALSYTWNGSPAAGPNIGPVAAGSYTLGVTDAAGCSATAGPFTISNVGGVTINASGAVVTNNTCSLSNGSVTGITASSPAGGLIYTWNGTAGTANLTGVVGGSYTLVVTDAIGCSATTGPYTITNLPGPTISGTATVTNESCAGNDGSITGLSVSGGTGTVDIAWNGTITGSASATGLTAGTYTLTATDDNGCVATSGPYTITNSGGPSINTASMVITNATCGNPNGSITGITTSGGTGTLTFTWNGTASPSTDLTSAGAGSYTLVVTDGSGCTATAGPFSITTSGGVTINTSGVVITDATCGATNGSVTGITSSSTAGGLTFDWNGTAYPSNDLTAVGGGTYTLTVTDAVGCTASAGPFTIQNIGAPVIDVSAINVSGTTCGLNNGTITGIAVTGGSGALTYDWNGTPSANQDLNASAAGSYTLTVTDATGCAQSAGPFTLAASNSITAGASVTTNASCFGYADGAASGSFTGGNGSETYQWIGGPATQNYTGIGAGTYNVIVTDVQGCSDTATVTITEPPSFNPTISGTSPICEGTSTMLTGTGGGSYSWSSGGSTSTETVSPTTTTTYTLTVTNGACSEDTTFTVVVNPLPVASISGTTVICDGQSTTLTASGGTSYVWNDASSGTSITVSPTADTPYYVIAQNSCGTDTAFVTVTVGAAFTVDAGPDQTIGLGNSANISASGGISWSWSPAGSLDCATCQSPTATPSGTTTYTVTATSAGGCTATDDVTIIVDATEALFVPDIFAPNGGMNNILYVRGSGISEFTFRVYDRWGQKVFETTELSLGWDGTYSGRTLDTGVFVYTLEGKFYSGNEFSQKGNVTLKR